MLAKFPGSFNNSFLPHHTVEKSLNFESCEKTANISLPLQKSWVSVAMEIEIKTNDSMGRLCDSVCPGVNVATLTAFI